MFTKKQNFHSEQKGYVLVLVIIFTFIFTVVALITMRIAVLHNSRMLREYNMARTFYAADGTIEQAAWIMSCITRGDALTDAEHNNPLTITPPRERPRFPAHNNESIIGVENTPGAATAFGSQNVQTTAGGQQFFGNPSIDATRRDIPFVLAAPSFDDPALTVPVWYPMVSQGYYRYDLLDDQIPHVMVHCRVEEEKIPNAIDGYVPHINAPTPMTVDADVFSGTSAIHIGSDGKYTIYRGNDADASLYLAANPGTGNPLADATTKAALATLINGIPEIFIFTKYYVIIADAKAENASSAGNPYRNIIRFHYLVAVSRQKTDPATVLNSSNIEDYFEDVTVDPGINVPGIGSFPCDALLKFSTSTVSVLYNGERFHGIFRSRR